MRALHHMARQAHRLHRIQPVDGEMRHMLAGRTEVPVLSAGHQHQHCARGRALDQGHEKRFGRRVDPVDILDHHDLQRRAVRFDDRSTIAARKASSLWAGV